MDVIVLFCWEEATRVECNWMKAIVIFLLDYDS